LAVDVGDVDAVAVNNGEMMDAAAHKALGAPAAYASDAKYDDTLGGYCVQCRIADEATHAVENGVLMSFHGAKIAIIIDNAAGWF
jgi:deoxyribodipyrimidine photolyase-like uncharacterized protein